MFTGIDIGGTYIKGILTDKTGKIYSFHKVPTPPDAGELVNAVCKLIQSLATMASISKIDIKAIGIGSAGTINRKKGIIISSPNISYPRNFPLAKKITDACETKVFLENDATAALVGSWWKGNGSRLRNWIMITAGTGIGGGVVVNNSIYTGQAGSSMEIGHMCIDMNGRPCECGNTGCLEKYSSASALENFIKKNIKKFQSSSIRKRIKEAPLSPEIIIEEALKKDGLALAGVKEISLYLGIGAVNLINIFNPEAIIIGGGLSAAHRIIIPEMRRIILERALPGLRENVEIMPIKDPDRIPALGAAKIAIDALN